MAPAEVPPEPDPAHEAWEEAPPARAFPWRPVALALLCVAAVLSAFIVYREFFWGREPGLVAVLQKDLAPAIAVRVEPATGVLYVRSLAPPPQSGNVYQLWLVGDDGTPRSLGTFTAGLAVRSEALRALGRGAVLNASLTVTEEPGGGAASGPTGQTLFSGRLVHE